MMKPMMRIRTTIKKNLGLVGYGLLLRVCRRLDTYHLGDLHSIK